MKSCGLSNKGRVTKEKEFVMIPKFILWLNEDSRRHAFFARRKDISDLGEKLAKGFVTTVHVK